MNTLRDVLENAKNNKTAIGHFNFSDMAQFWGIVRATQSVGVPVILGVSEGERSFIGIRQAVALVKSVRDELGLPVFINADHTRDLEKVREAVEAGCDSVIFDGVKLSLEDNISKTKEAVRIAREANQDILVEGEIGYIGQSSEVFETLPDGASVRSEDLPTAEDAFCFVKETGVDLLAPAVGNVHGMFKNAPNPDLDIGLIGEVATKTKVPLVLHGGSGVVDKDFVSAIDAGVRIVHISTEVRVAWRKGLDDSLRENPKEIAPYKIFKDVVFGVSSVVEKRLKLFSRV